MKPQEAISLVKECGLNIEGSLYAECEKAVLNSLEKQIPKKVIVHGIREGREVNIVSYTCPECSGHIGRDNFCKHCGQALDWGEVSDDGDG